MEKQCFVNEYKCYFNLRSKKSDKPTNVYMITCIDNKQVKLSTNVKVYPSQWNNERQEAYVSPRLTELDNMNNSIVNNKLLELHTSFNEYKEYLCNNPNEITKSKEVLIKFIYKNNPMANKANKDNVIHKLNELIIKDKSIKESTKIDYLRQIKLFERFLISANKSPLPFDKVNLVLLKEYEEYLYNKVINETKNKTTKTSTVNDKIVKIIAILKRAETYGLIDITASKIDRYKKTKVKEDGDNEIFLNENEIEQLYNLKLDGSSEKVRDIFVLLCYVGQRFSDIEKLNNGIVKNTQNGKIIEIAQTKRNHKVTIPLLPISEEILTKYNYKLPIFSAYTVTSLIKKIGREANITRLHIVQSDRGGKVSEERKEACELIGTHTARRSFISNMLKRGYDSSILMKITGHSTMESFKKYIKLTSEDAAVSILLKENNAQSLTEKSSTVVEQTIQEAKEVLSMLGVNPTTYISINDISKLWTMVGRFEHELLERGVSVEIVKEVYNKKNCTLSEKADFLNRIIKELS